MTHSRGEALAYDTLDEVLAARQAARDLLDEGWTRSVVIEPLTALAGGIIGGTLVALAAWRSLNRRQ